MSQTTPQQQEGGNMAALENRVVKLNLIHGRQCLQDQEYSETWESTIEGQEAVKTFNRALFEMKETNIPEAVLELLKYEIRMLEKEMVAADD